MIYQRRMLCEAMKTKALLVASINPEKAEKAAQEYMEIALPICEGARDEQLKARERELTELANMEPIKLGGVTTRPALNGTQQWGTGQTSMRKR